MSVKDLENTFNEYRSTVESFVQSNDKRMKSLEETGTNSAQLQGRVEKMDQSLQSMESEMTRVKTALQRPSVGTISEKSAAASEHQNVFMDYIRKGLDAGLAKIEQKALSVGSDPEGGYTVPQESVNQVLRLMNASSSMRTLAAVITTRVDAIEFLAEREQAASGWVSETAARDETSAGKFSKIRIPVHEHYAEPRITQKLLDDSAMNLEQWLSESVSSKMVEAENDAFINGSGIGAPRGILTYPEGNDWGHVQQFQTGKGSGFADDNPLDVLYDTIHSLKPGYLSNATWVMARSTLAEIRKLRDAEGRYIWQPALDAQTPATLLGYPVHIADTMPAPAEGSLSIAFGDFRQAYTIVDRQGIKVLRDPYTAKPYVKFYVTKRVGGDVTNFDAFKLINFS